jgi:hypothetical protein
VAAHVHEQLRPEQMHLRKIGLGGEHPLEAFDRLLRPIHRNERHAAAIPGINRTRSRGECPVEACDRLGVAAQPAENDAE